MNLTGLSFFGSISDDARFGEIVRGPSTPLRFAQDDEKGRGLRPGLRPPTGFLRAGKALISAALSDFPNTAMKRHLLVLFTLTLAFVAGIASAAEPLRIYIRSGVKTHGPNAHDHPHFLATWKPLLTERGMKVDGAIGWPSAAQFAQTDVVIVDADEAGDATAEEKANVEAFTKRGGGLVVIHAASVAMKESAWWKATIGGSWVKGTTKWREGPMDLYFVENQRLGEAHPITKGASNFQLDDEIYYDMDISPDVRVLATSYTPNVPAGKKAVQGAPVTIFDIQPQMWAYEHDGYRAFVSIPGHYNATFERPNYRAILLRGIAWAGKRANVDEFCKPDEIAALTYPEGGPQRPADTLKALEVHPDFNMKLVAAEPLITKPMNFDWDPAGRMWVAETPEYPNGRRGMRPDYRGKEWKDHGGIDATPGKQDRKGLDKISILTDTDGDGVADKKEVFYEGLELVTGLVFYKDGVIVTQAPDILWLRDTDGDGKADKVEKLYTGLGTGDTHAVINNPRWGWDGWIYCTHGYSGSRDVTSGDGAKHFGTIGSGVVRFKPDGSAFEQYSSKGGNTWGLEITGDNRVMWTQPTSGQLLMQTVLPEYALARGKVSKDVTSYKVVEPSLKTFPAMSWEQQAYRQIDWVGLFTAAAGCVIYDGGSWPAEYNGDYFCTEPTINIVHHARLTPEGSSYTFHKLPGREETEFIRSKDMWWRPIEVRVGPDGAMYVGDFYNQAVIHNDTRGPDHNEVNAAVRPDRDHYFGRIWRVDQKDAKKLVVPDLSKAGVAELVKALEHPNRVVRMTASRLLLDRANPLPKREKLWLAGEQEKHAALMETNFGYQSLLKLALDPAKPAEPRVAALWILGQRDADELMLQWTPALADKDPVVRRNAALLAELPHYTFPQSEKGTRNFVTSAPAFGALLTDSDPQVRVAALRALGTSGFEDAAAQAIIAAWPKLDDDFQRSAAIGAAAQNPAASIAAALDAADSAPLAPLVSQLAQSIGEKNNADAAAKLVISLSTKPASADALKRSVLDTLGKSLKDAPAMTSELSGALGKLLAGGASGSALPLAAKWDKAGALKAQVAQLTTVLLAKLNDAESAEAARFSAAESLLGLRSANPDALPAVIKVATGKASPALQRQLIVALGETGDAGVGTALAGSFGKLPAEAQGSAFEVLLQRADWALALLDAAKAKQADLTILGPANLARLRTHPDKAVSQRANALLDELMGPALAAKNEALAKLTPIVEQPGDAVKGKAIFTATCAICHKLGELGTDIGPALTGMGAHGPAELLTAIIDPNREVDPSFVAWNIETKDGKFHAGVIARENPANIVLKSLAGQEEIKVSEIKSRVNTGRSLMPEGFEGLGGETLRDILTFICGADAQHFRVLDLAKAFTADTRHGIYMAPTDVPENFHFAKTGLLNLGGIPFNLVAAEKSPTGNNAIQLKGGQSGSFAKTKMPKSVEINVGGFKANRLHFLGNVGGWASPYGEENEVVMKAVVQFAGGASETLEFRNGVEFADYIGRVEVPGSRFAEGVTKNGQVRWSSKQLKTTAPIEKITLESADSGVAPTTFAITAELAEANAAPLAAVSESASAPAPKVVKPALKAAGDFVPQFTDAVPEPPTKAAGMRALMVGGGSSHDFAKYYGGTDKATLAAIKPGWLDYTQNANGTPAILDRVDVLAWSANQPVSSETATALIKFANAGKGLVIEHPGTWYAWNNFPQWNHDVVGGGARGHDALGEFEVEVIEPNHPLMAGLPKTFKITDELYNFVPDPTGVPIKVLAQAKSPKTGKVFPQVWIVEHPKSRVVCITLGHDARAHDLPEYQTLIKNAFVWAAGK